MRPMNSIELGDAIEELEADRDHWRVRAERAEAEAERLRSIVRSLPEPDYATAILANVMSKYGDSVETYAVLEEQRDRYRAALERIRMMVCVHSSGYARDVSLITDAALGEEEK